MTIPIRPRDNKRKRRYDKKPLLPIVDKTTSYDTLTRGEFMRLRYGDEESPVIEEEKEEETE